MKAANGGLNSFPSYSSLELALSLSPSSRRLLPPFLLLHGASDQTVPYSSSIRFAYALAGGYQRGARPIPIQKLPSHKVYHKEDNNGDEHTDIDRSFTFPRAISSDPLIHVRIVGGASDPLQCDHASFILDIMRTRSNRIKDDDASREVSTVGHTRWVMEAIQAFMAEAEQREKMNPAQTTTQTETTPTPNPNITARL